MQKSFDAAKLLRSATPADAINHELWRSSLEDRFRWLESLRQAALARLADAQRPQVMGMPTNAAALFNEKSIAMQRQFEALDRGICGTLDREGRIASYVNWTRSDDPDMPDDPNDLAQETEAYKYGLKRLYRRQFEVSVNEHKNGCWPLLLFDQLEPIDGTRILAIAKTPLAVEKHNSPEYLRQLGSADLKRYLLVFEDTKQDLAEKLRRESARSILDVAARGRVDKAAIILMIFDGLMRLVEFGYELYKDMLEREEKERQAREAREAAEREAAARAAAEKQEKIERELREWSREPKEIPGSSDHVDRHERNNDAIDRMC